MRGLLAFEAGKRRADSFDLDMSQFHIVCSRSGRGISLLLVQLYGTRCVHSCVDTHFRSKSLSLLFSVGVFRQHRLPASLHLSHQRFSVLL
jgi:hypothetical protein